MENWICTLLYSRFCVILLIEKFPITSLWNQSSTLSGLNQYSECCCVNENLIEIDSNMSLDLIFRRSLIQSFCRRCVKCILFKTYSLAQQISPLPKYRLAPQRSFAITGLDCVEAPLIRAHKVISLQKALNIFVCMVARVQLEVVSDLVTTTFLATHKLQRAVTHIPSPERNHVAIFEKFSTLSQANDYDSYLSHS